MNKFKTILNHARPISPHGGVSMTDPQYLKDCDINVLLNRYLQTGSAPVSATGVYGDFSSFGDFQQCMEKVNSAKADFLGLPSQLRARFGNDPAAFVSFVLDPNNAEECIRLGLREKPVPSEDSAVDVLKRIEKTVTPKGVNPSGAD